MKEDLIVGAASSFSVVGFFAAWNPVIIGVSALIGIAVGIKRLLAK